MNAEPGPGSSLIRHTGLWLAGAVALLIVLSSWQCSSSEEANRTRAAEVAAAASSAAQQRAAAGRAECMAMQAAVTAEYNQHMAAMQYGDAADKVQKCARRGDANFVELFRSAMALAYAQRARDTKGTLSSRLEALGALEREYPPAYTKEMIALTASLERQRVAAEKAEERQRVAAEKAAERKVLAAKRREGVTVGMTKDEVLQSSWGKPERVNTSTYTFGTREQWVYGSGNYLYFSGDVLTSISSSR